MANVSGYIEDAVIPMCAQYEQYLTAEYPEAKHTWCPGNPVNGNREKIAHGH